MFNVRTFSFSLSLFLCYLYSNHGYEISSKSVDLYPPWFVTYRYVNENYQVACRCTELYHEIRWVKLNQSKEELGLKLDTRPIQKGVVLVFANITKKNEGDYECIAYDKNKNVKYTNQFTLIVEEPIVFVSPVVYEAVLDENVYLECEINEKNSLKRHWEFEGNVLPRGQLVWHFYTGVVPTCSSSFADHRSLFLQAPHLFIGENDGRLKVYQYERFQFYEEAIRIPEVGLRDAGKYCCVISHWPFQSTRNILEITLIVYYKPVPRTISNIVYGFVDEVVSVVCEVNANPNPWFIWYNKYREPINSKNDNITILVQNDTSILKVLLTEPLQETFYICEACNELGCLEQTIYINKTTKLRTPVLGLWDIDSDSAEFYVSTQAEASLYIFQYFFDIDEDKQWETPFEKNFSTILPRAKMDSYIRYEVDELHPDTRYILRVASANQYTKSEFSEERRFKTRLGRTIHSICNVCSCTRSYCPVVLLLPFINSVLFKNIFY